MVDAGRKTQSIARTLFWVLVLGILVPATLIWGLGHLTARAAVTFLWDGLSDEIADHTVERTLRYLETGPTALSYNASAVAQKRADPSDRRALLAYLLSGLEANPNVTWYSFGGADGAYLSAYRTDGGARLTWREQEGDAARYRDFLVRDDGSWKALPEVVKPYDPRTRPWYTEALASDESVWSKPFLFASGPPGFILSKRATGPDGSRLGVWGIEYEMAYVSEFLATLEIGKTGRAYLVTAAGDVIGHPLASGAMGEARGYIAVQGEDKKRIASTTDHRDPWLIEAYALATSANGEEDQFTIDGASYLTASTRVPNETGLDWIVLIVVPEDDILGEIHRNEIYAALAALVIAFMVLLLGLAHARRRLSGPLAAIADDLEDMARLETDREPRVAASTISEVAGMIHAREVMRSGMRSFKRYVPAELVQELMASGQEARLGGEDRILTVMFSDLVGFTEVSEKIGDPRELVKALGEYLHVMSDQINTRGGTVDKYIGDAIMAFWGAPRPVEDHPLRACEAAWASQEILRERRSVWRAEGRPEFRARIGVNTGPALVGNIGCEDRMNYTVMGDSVNLAARLEGICKIYGIEIAVGDETRDAVLDHFATRPVDCVEVKGRTQPTIVYELIGPVGEVDPERQAFATAYTSAFERYRARDFQGALDGLKAATDLRPDDVSTGILRERCEQFLRTPPPEDWNGVFRLTRKS